MVPVVLIRKGFRYRIYPTPEQVKRLAGWESSLRFLWNLAHEQRLMGLARTGRRFPTSTNQDKELTALRAELPWLADVPRNACGQLLIELDRAWQRCFKRVARTPRWKRKGGEAPAICESHARAWEIDDSGLSFPKLGSISVVKHRPLEGKPKSCTIRRDGNQWFASITCEIEVTDPTPRTEPVVALDRGVVNVVADSDGNVIESPRFYSAAMARLARAQRNVSRKKKGSANRKKAKARVANIHRKVRRQREFVVHNLSSAYAKSHGTVVVEKLQIDNMVRASRSMARGILDAGWGRLIRCLRYKLAWAGGTLVEVPAAYSSQTCHRCGHVDAASRFSQAEFCCTGCGATAHADVNAAKVLKSRANRSALPVEGSPSGARRSRKRTGVARRQAEHSASS
jgi:putative transposase